MTDDVLHDMYHMAIKYAPEPKEHEKYNVKVTKRKTKYTKEKSFYAKH